MSGRSGGSRGVRVLWAAAAALSVLMSDPRMLGGAPHALAQDRAAPAPAPVFAPKVLLIDAGGAADADLAARIAGQTRDLPLLLEPTSSSEPDFDRARAQALAGQRGAAAVVWFAPAQPGAIEVHVLDALRGSERTRMAQLQPQAQPSDDPLSRSALFETTALIVRSELANLLEQENLAKRAADADAARAKGTGATAVGAVRGAGAKNGQRGTGAGSQDETPDDDRDGADDDNADDNADDPDRRPGAWSARAGFRLARVDSDHLAYGPLLGLGYDAGPFAFGLQAATAWPFEIERDQVTLELRRHSAGLSALFVALDSRSVRLLAGVEGGALLYARDTVHAGTLLSTPASTAVSAAFGASAELQWLPTPVVGAALGAGLDLLTSPPKFALIRAGQEQVLHRIAVYEPWATLSIVLRP